jgi:hypothetical protein
MGSEETALISATNNSSSSTSIAIHGRSNKGVGIQGVCYEGCGVKGMVTGNTTRVCYGVYGKSSNTTGTNYGLYGVASDASSGLNCGIYAIGYNPGAGNAYAGYFEGDVYVKNNISAYSYTDRTPYPKDTETAYKAVMSMERLPEGQYSELDRNAQLDHSKLHNYIRSEDGNRDLSATVSCHNEVLKDLILKQKELCKAHLYIKKLQKQNESLEARLTKLELMIAKNKMEKE